MAFPTYGEMCEQILASPRCPASIKSRFASAEALFNCSPTGELWPVFNLWLKVIQPTLDTPSDPCIGAMRGPNEHGEYEIFTGDEWV